MVPQPGGDDAKAFGGQLTPVSFVVGLYPLVRRKFSGAHLRR